MGIHVTCDMDERKSELKLVSVVLPAHRNDNLLRNALDSILNQSYPNIEIILADNSETGFKSITSRGKIKYIRTNPVWNLSQVLNFAVVHSQGEYVARMDSDDIAISTRIEKQVEFLEKEKDVGVLGSSIQILSSLTDGHWANGKIIYQPLKHEEIQSKMFYKNPFFHPTVMFRKSLLERYSYNPRYERAQDYRLWVSLYNKTRFANLEEPLLLYRFHKDQVGNVDQILSRRFAKRAQMRLSLNSIITNDSNIRLGLESIKHHSASYFHDLIDRHPKKSS